MKGLLKYKVLMKSCLVGEQYHLTRLLKKSCLKDQSTSSRSFQGLGVASVLLWHRAERFEIQRRESRELSSHALINRYLLNLQRLKKQLGQKPTPSLSWVPRGLGLCYNQHQPRNCRERAKYT